jgi:hypothetical protein
VPKTRKTIYKNLLLLVSVMAYQGIIRLKICNIPTIKIVREIVGNKIGSMSFQMAGFGISRVDNCSYAAR